MQIARQPLRTLVGSLAIVLSFTLLLMPTYPTATAQHAAAVSSQSEILLPPPTPVTFQANPGSLGPIPDGISTGFPLCRAPRIVTFTVTGMSAPLTDVEVSFTMSPLHPKVGDLTATLHSPSSVARRILFSRTGANTQGPTGSNADLDGQYTFTDSAINQHWWTAALSPVVSTLLPYRTVGPGVVSVNPPFTQLTAAFAGLTTQQINGTWTLRICDVRRTNTGAVSAASLKLTGTCDPCPSCKTLSDFDGDGRDDMAVWRPSNGYWFSIDTTPPNLLRSQQWGQSGDIITPGDYDGDGVTDYAVWRASASPFPRFFIIYSSGPPPTFPNHNLGAPSDIPVPMDYDGDGKFDLAVWNPSTTTWTIIRSTGGPPLVVTIPLSQSTDVPIPRDYDGDCKADIAQWRPVGGVWTIIRSTNNTTVTFSLGSPGDIPVPADYDGDGVTDIAVWSPSTGMWTIRPSSGGPDIMRAFGVAGDEPMPFCCDGDGQNDVAVYRPSSNTLFCLHSSTGIVSARQFGISGDVFVLGAYVLP